MAYTPLDLTGKSAVVIGGSSGIGRAIAHGLAEAGADVVPTSRRADQVEAAAQEIEERGRRTLRLTSDVCDRGSLERLLSATIDAFGKVDIMINSAGRTKRAPTLEVPESDWADILDTNLTRHAAGLPDIWTPYGGTALWPNRQHRVAGLLYRRF
jgi:NAD(P)-dependent dehydrogenase (short-subunit alcohol dehydrogenase family)